MFELHDKVALITGAAGGLGDKIARTLHKQGATLALTDMREEPMLKLKEELGDRVEVFTANLTNADDVKNLVAKVEEKLGRIDILVNNAGLTRDNLFIRMSDEDWQLVLDVNLSAGFKLAKAAVRGMMKRRFGRIIGIASVVSVVALGNASQAKIMEQISSMGTNTIDIMPGTGFGDMRSGKVKTLKVRDSDYLAQQGFIVSSSPSVSASGTLVFENYSLTAQLTGVGDAFFEVKGKDIAQGRTFTEEEVSRIASVVVVDDNTRKEIFSDKFLKIFRRFDT